MSVFSRRDGWRGTVLVYLIYRLDALLRYFYRIREFTDDPNCLLLLAMKQASTPLSLSDGTRIMPGDPIGELHLWNDHLPRFPSGGPTLGWARRAHALMVHSLSLLADHVATEPEWQGAAAFYAEVPISPKRSPASVRAVSQTYGFEPTLWRRTVWRSVHDVIESLLLGGLPTPTILLRPIDKDSCGTGSGYGSVARPSFGCMAPAVHCGVEASLRRVPFGPGPLTGSDRPSLHQLFLASMAPRRSAIPPIGRRCA